MEISIQRKAIPEKADKTLKKNHKGMKEKKKKNGRPGNELRCMNHSEIWQHFIEVLNFPRQSKKRQKNIGEKFTGQVHRGGNDLTFTTWNFMLRQAIKLEDTQFFKK